MRKTLFSYSLSTLVVGVILGWSAPAFAGDDGSLLKQAEDLVKQAWNPGGDAPSADDRTKMLTQALELTQKEPDHRLGLNRVAAMKSIKAALEEIKMGDPNNKVNGDLQDADRSLRDAIEIAESHG